MQTIKFKNNKLTLSGKTYRKLKRSESPKEFKHCINFKGDTYVA